LNKFVVGYSGNLGRAHDFGTIIRAAGLLSNIDDIVFLFIGGGAQYEKLRAQVSLEGINNILFKPYQPRDKLRYSLGAPDVHLVTLQAALEGLIVPSKFYGVLAAGRPTVYIGAEDGEVPGIIREASCGMTVEHGNVSDLRACLETLHGNTGLVEKMGFNARAIFEKRFNKSAAIEAWRTVIRAAMQEATTSQGQTS